MRLALLLDDYIPTSTRVHGKMIYELAQELVRKGHKPTIIMPGQPDQEKRLNIDIENGITFWSFRNGPTRGVGKIKRGINETLLSYNAWLAIRQAVAQTPFDGVINYSPSIFYGGLVKLLKKRCRCPSYLVLRDLFPQWAIDEGLMREKSLIAKYFKFFEHLNYRTSDYIGLMSDANMKVFSQINPGYDNAHVLHNWAKMEPSYIDKNGVSIRSQLDLTDKIIFFYGGNIGHAQDMANLMRLARSMSEEASAHFLFVGAGDEFDLINSLKDKWQLNNATIYPSVSQQEFKNILAQVDIGLFSLSKTHKAHNFPGKLLGYMAQSLPILGSVNKGNDLADFINNYEAGFVFENGQDNELYNAAKVLLGDAVLRRKLGKNSNELLKKYFSVEAAVDKIVETLDMVSKTNSIVIPH